MSLSEGQQAPDFTLPDDRGEPFSLAAHHGKTVIIFFYPRDDTSGCTLEARGFSAALGAFEAAGAVVVGLSADTVDSHQRFREKHELAVRLIADTDHVALEAFGVWREKSMYGRKFMGIVRTTVLVGRDGRIARIWPKVRVRGHVEKVLEAAEELNAAQP
ncbi:MAG: peroxiredoxin [Alphaproteobacteria bacterium]